jgi:uncharacterized C2H2 Zn-finger protein
VQLLNKSKQFSIKKQKQELLAHIQKVCETINIQNEYAAITDSNGEGDIQERDCDASDKKHKQGLNNIQQGCDSIDSNDKQNEYDAIIDRNVEIDTHSEYSGDNDSVYTEDEGETQKVIDDVTDYTVATPISQVTLATGVVRSQCPYCIRLFCDQKVTRRHIVRDHLSPPGPDDSFCPICNRKFQQPKNLRLHLEKLHPDTTVDELNAIDKKTKWVGCTCCNIKFQGPASLQYHTTAMAGKAKAVKAGTTRPKADRLQSTAVIKRKVQVVSKNKASVEQHEMQTQYSSASELLSSNGHLLNTQGLVGDSGVIPAYLSDDLGASLISFFGQALYFIDRFARVPANKLACSFIADMCSDDDAKSHLGTIAFQILPGFIRALKLQKTPKVAAYLERMASQQDPAHVLTEAALNLVREANASGRRATRASSPKSYKQVMESVNSLVDEYRYSNALSTVIENTNTLTARGRSEEEPSSSSTPYTLEEYREIISNLHPSANDLDELPDESEDPPGLVITAGAVEKELRGLKKGVASGWSGWTNQALQAIFLSDETVSESCEKLAKFFNKCLSGEINKGVIHLFGTSRSVLIPKPDKTVRPIGIGEALYRLMGRIISGLVQIDIGEQLLPLQFAVGVKGGGEIVARIAQLHYDTEGLALLRFDVSNAFNELRRSHIWNGLHTYCPGLCKLFRTFYGSPSDLRRTGGELVGRCQTGVKQGDALGGIYFCCGGHAAVTLPLQQELDAAMIRYSDKNKSAPNISYIAKFSDDGYLGAPIEVAEEMSSAAVRIYADAGLRIKASKSEITGRSIDTSYDTSRCCFPPAVGGMKVVGCPIGSPAYVTEYMQEKVNKLTAPLQTLVHVDTQAAYILTHKCVNQRLSYLSRILEGDFLEPIYQTFDYAVTDTIATLVDSPSCSGVDTVHKLRCLPQKHGGLGMIAYMSVEGEKGKYKSRELTEKFVHTYMPLMNDKAESWKGLPSLLDDYVKSKDEGKGDASKSLEEVVEAYHVDVRQGLLDDLVKEGREPSAAWLCSGSTKSGCRWLFWRGGFTRRFRLNNQQMVDALRMRLLLPPSNSMLDSACVCDRTIAANEDYHFLSCNKNAWFTKQRHDMVTKLLKEFIHGVLPQAKLTLEPVYTCSHGDDIQGDLQVQDEHHFHAIDVSIVNPARASLQLASGIPRPDHAAQRAETAKRSNYATVTTPGVVSGFVPFVVEATGRLGPEARSFVANVSRGNTAARTYFLNCMSACIARYNSSSFAAARKRMLYYKGNGWDPSTREVDEFYPREW